MLVNADFSERVALPGHQHRWVTSPQGGVERVMLDRVGDEKARATSLVRYRPRSTFPEHPHPGGEEILVLSGTFSDEAGDHPAGWYLRNPPGSSHRPFSHDGAVIFVKLWQMPPGERLPVRLDTRPAAAWQNRGATAVCPLFHSETEQVCLHRLSPGALLAPEASGGAEVLLLKGSLAVDGSRFEAGSWWRLPPGDALSLQAGSQGATAYVKTGHLAHVLGAA